ncbi:hypothetical protein EOM33_06250 [Candidatus Saccharibacteria bacterium]|nr:hypothetical protein [Candidatus Saccharibacteria bacterium]
MQDTELLRQVLDCKLYTIRFEVMLYSLPDDFTVYIDYDGKQLKKPYRVTRNRKQYELSSSPTRYSKLIRPAEMHNVIRRHLDYECERLKGFDIDTDKLSNGRIEQAAKVLEVVQDPRSRRQTLFNLQPRWTPRTNDNDELYDEAVSLVARTQIADTTFIRDQLSIGNSQAEAIVRRLEDEGLVGRLGNGALKRAVLVSIDESYERKVKSNANK